MSIKQSFLGGAPAAQLYVDNVFSTYLYTGNGSTQTITNGIDLAGKGGLVWIKNRDISTGTSHALIDTVRGRNSRLSSNDTYGYTDEGSGGITSFNTNGFSVNQISDVAMFNQSGNAYTSWTFRKSPRFFDVVTYTGNGVAGRTIAHNLGVAPGMIVVKRTDSTGAWDVWHRSLTTGILNLNGTDAEFGAMSSYFGDGTGGTSGVSITSSSFTVSANDALNGNTFSYVAYLFAHDTSETGIIQCGSFTTDGSGNATVNLGWEPQFVLAKSSTAVTNWVITDTMRGMTANTSGTDAILRPNLSSAEFAASDGFAPNATGFKAWGWAASATYIYLAIRRPNKPPTSGTEVYNAIARTGTGAAATINQGITTDLVLLKNRGTTYGMHAWDRLRGSPLRLSTATTDAEASTVDNFSGFDVQTGYKLPSTYSNVSGNNYIDYALRRAPGVFDVVCYTGTGIDPTTFSHSLGVTPELQITKIRTGTTNDWVVTSKTLFPSNSMRLNTTAGSSGVGNAGYDASVSSFTWGNNGLVNGSTYTYVSYLFATKPGISKVGSYTGNGSTQTINCGFTTGARFFLAKATSTTGSWWIYDSARGVVAGYDPSLALNSTAAEVTNADAVDPDNSGIIVNQEATCSINANGVSYIFLAFS